MKKAVFVVLVASFVAMFIAGCGDGATKACEVSGDCVFGEVCVDLVCVERPCNGRGDCSTGEVCVPGDLVDKDPGMKYCSAPCSELKPCTKEGTYCNDEGICVTGSVVNDIVETDTTVEDVIDRDNVVEEVAADVPQELPPITEELDCKVCTVTADCGTGYTCQPVGAEKHCLRDCNNDGDCMAGYTCYTSGSQKSCLPVSYNCVPCTFESPCEEGKCCDFTSGQCKDCQEECFSCTYDYDCEPGLRCYKKTGSATGVCVPECPEGTCEDTEHYTCTDNGKGVDICQPTTDGCKGCEEPTPYPYEGGCVECRNNDDCAENEMCNTNDHTCMISECAGDTIMCSDMECHQCCEDDDCLRFPEATGVCDEDGNCEGVVACGGLCTDDFPVCAVVQGVEQCVQCLTDSDCAMIRAGCTCVGDPLYSCVDETGAICQKVTGSCDALCEDSGDCPPTSTGGSMECALISGGTSGYCYDPAGTCDGSSACCAPGMKCYDIMLLLMSGMMGGMMPIDPAMMQSGSGYCECGTEADCINGKPCTDLSIICVLGSLLDMLGPFVDMICPGGQLSPAMPQHLCLDFADLLGGII